MQNVGSAFSFKIMCMSLRGLHGQTSSLKATAGCLGALSRATLWVMGYRVCNLKAVVVVVVRQKL